MIDTQHAIAGELGYASYRELCAECKGFDLAALHAQTADFGVVTQSSYPEVIEPVLRRTLGLSLSELRRSDLPRFFRAPDLDSAFPTDELIPSLTTTMRGLGIDLADQPGVVLDIEPAAEEEPARVLRARARPRRGVSGALADRRARRLRGAVP